MILMLKDKGQETGWIKYTEQNELYFGYPVPGIQLVERGGQMVGSKLNCTPGKQEEKNGWENGVRLRECL